MGITSAPVAPVEAVCHERVNACPQRLLEGSRQSKRAGLESQKKVNLLVDTERTLEYLACPCKLGTGGNDCSVQFFDNRIACDGPNAIPKSS